MKPADSQQPPEPLMADEPSIIGYETPAEHPPRTHPIVRWMGFDALLFVATFLWNLAVYHDRPPTYKAPPAVELLLTILLIVSITLFLGLLGWGAALMFRRQL